MLHTYWGIHHHPLMIWHHIIHAFDAQLASFHTHTVSQTSLTLDQSPRSLSLPLNVHCNSPLCFTFETISSNIPQLLSMAAHRINARHQSWRQHDTSKHVFDFLHKLFHTADRHHLLADTQCTEQRQRDIVSSISGVIYRKWGDGKQVGVKAWRQSNDPCVGVTPWMTSNNGKRRRQTWKSASRFP